MARVGVIGTTAWGLTLAVVLARRGHDMTVLARTGAEASDLERARRSPRLPDGADFPPTLRVTADPAEALGQAGIVLVAVPSVTMRANMRAQGKIMPPACLIISATKGIEIETGRRMSELIAEETGHDASKIGALSGPNLAPEIAQGLIASATVAFPDEANARVAQGALNSEVFRVYRSDDLNGVELGGALKNIVAIGAGFIEGFSLGDNAKAAYVTRGLHEITRLGVAMGARAETFAGLSGMGDLVATCYSGLSRNRRVGQELARGRKLPEILRDLKQTAEGVPTTQAASRLARELGVEMPITEMTRRVLFEDLTPQKAVEALMRRAPQPEVRG
jgi:glycerol-3-phosphate dehydrogenase (NAD(P)+)